MAWGLKKPIKDYLEKFATGDLYENGALNLRKLSEKIGIKGIILAEFYTDQISGLLRKEKDGWKIYVNETDSPSRRRFTIAHEIGHYISYINDSYSKPYFDKNGEISDLALQRRNGMTGSVEAEANTIAADLLMSKKDIERMVNENKTIEEMAEYFQVSETAMSVRLEDMGIIPFESYGRQGKK